MDQLKTLIQKLTDAANGGEDNSVLLALVEEIGMMLKEPVIPENISSAISVMMPSGFRPAQPDKRNLPNVRMQYSVPRPPTQVIVEETKPAPAPAINTLIEVASQEVEMESIPTMMVEPIPMLMVEEPTAAPITVLPESIAVEAVAAEKPARFSAWEAGDNLEAPPMLFEQPAAVVPIQMIDKVEDKQADVAPVPMSLELTQEMIAEAVALERLAINPEAELEWEPQPAPVTEKVKPQDLNEKMAQRSKMLNEVFAQPKAELATVLVESRIQDLRKAISINEKYQYINSLFRGDEDMFERSIKTLNNFNIMPEAEYWMQRELLIKLGWNDEDELVQRFYTLVKRRFV